MYIGEVLTIDNLNKIVTNAQTDFEYKHGKSLQEVDYNLDIIKAIDIAYEKAESYFSKYKRTPIKQIKKSQVVGELLRYDYLFETYNIKVQVAFKIILFIYNIVDLKKVNSWMPIPDRLICKRFSIGRETLNRILTILKRTSLVDCKFVNGIFQIQLHKKYFVSDRYFNKRAQKEMKVDKAFIDTFLAKRESLSYPKYSDKALENKRVRLFLGLTLAGALLNNGKNNSAKRNEDIQTYGYRSQIIYFQMPWDALKKAFNIKPIEEARFITYVRNSVHYGSYLSKRDKSYQNHEAKNNSAYYEENHQRYDLVDYRLVEEDADRLYIDKNSHILYVKEFAKTHNGRYVLEHLDEYVKLYLILQNEQGFISDLTMDILLREEEVASHLDDSKEHKNLKYKKDNVGMSIVTANQLKQEHKPTQWFGERIKFDFMKGTLEQAVNTGKLIFKAFEKFPFMSNNQFNYYRSLLSKLKDFIKEQVAKASDNSFIAEQLDRIINSKSAEWIFCD